METKKKKPNLFVVGAPHSGTTSLYHYLKQHPNIFMSEQKELGYEKFTEYHPAIKTEKEYLKHFETQNGEKIIGEATPSYIYSKRAPKGIFNFNSKAKIIMILRDPNQSLVSNFSGIFNRGVGFDEPHFEMFNHKENVKRFLKIFPRNQVLILDFADFSKNTKKVYKEILTFLNVDTSFETNLKIHNKGYDVKSKAFKKFIEKYYWEDNKLKTVAKKIISKKFAQKIADLNKIYPKNKKQSTYGGGGYDVTQFD